MSPPGRLCELTLAQAPHSLGRPRYARRALSPGVVHIGPGAFHRAHQAPAFDRVAEEGDLRWGIVDVSLRSGAATRALAAQDGLFILESRRSDETRRAVIGSILRAIDSSADARAAIEAVADPQVRLATLTVTEPGYADAALGRALAAGLALRQARGLGGLTLLSCDNLQDNGRRLAALVAAGAGAAGAPNLVEWISRACAFPSSVVDRITPAANAADHERLTAETGFVDEALTLTEPYSQWIIENDFVGERPPLEAAGVVFVDDVSAYARLKLRMLNAAHSALAWLGLPQGLAWVHDAFADNQFRAFVEALWAEAAGTLGATPAIDLASYQAQIGARFANAALPHRLDQIATDGSAKLAPRILAPMSARLAAGQPTPALALCVAAWASAQRREGRNGRFAFTDAQDHQIAKRLAGTRGARDAIRALIDLEPAVPRALAQDAAFRSAVLAAGQALDDLGTVGAMASAANLS